MTFVQNPPKKHHYIPVFYLRRWLGADGKLVQFSRPHDRLLTHRVHPNATGYSIRGYELRGFKPEFAQQVETHFFQPTDSWASDALSLLENCGANHGPWDLHRRSAWTRFLLSLCLRCPEDIESLRKAWLSGIRMATPEKEEEYRRIRRATDPPLWRDFVDQQPVGLIEGGMFKLLFRLVDNKSLGKTINNMAWQVIEFPETCFPLLTSDRPVTFAFSAKEKSLGLPIGPRRFFFASSSIATIDRVRNESPAKLAKVINRYIVEGAAKYVYGSDQGQYDFIRKRIGSVPQLRLVDYAIRGSAS